MRKITQKMLGVSLDWKFYQLESEVAKLRREVKKLKKRSKK